MNIDTRAQAQHALNRYRQEVYRNALKRRRAALFDLGEAVLTAPGRCNMAHLSLSPLFQRKWPSVPDALADGRLAPGRIRALIRPLIPQQTGGGRPVWAVDGTVFPRPQAETSPERTYGHYRTAGIPRHGVIPAWEYQWLGMVPQTTGSWFLPLDVARRGIPAGKPTAVAISQLRRVRHRQPPGTPRPVVTFDSNYDVGDLARAQHAPFPPQRLDLDVLVRVHPRRTFFRRPDPVAYAGRGRRPLHGAPFKLPDPTTQGEPDRAACVKDPRYGVVTVLVWADLHPFGQADLSLTLVRVSAEPGPGGRRLKPLWLAWSGAGVPADPLDLWRWYRLRFVCEHLFRFLKQDLGWTTVRPRWPQAADRWTWLLVLAIWHLWLARDLVADQPLPWERSLPPGHLTPGRVRHALGPFLPGLTHPQAPVHSRGKSPGRARGAGPGPRQRFRVVKRPKKPPNVAA